jgi:tRNA-Thr(GGU) m(6)t(6)A37 methyltransferase TsaA
MGITLDPIGFVKTDAQEIPRHWTVSTTQGKLVIDKKLTDGLKGIAKGQRIVVIFQFHRSPLFSPEFLLQTPRRRKRPTGVFSICSPIRPNPIGLSVVEVLERRKSTIHVKGLDMEDGTPILDIKPHVDENVPAPGPAAV